MLDDHTSPGLNTITVLRWQYGGPRTQEFAPGPTLDQQGSRCCNAAVDQAGGVEGTKQVEALQCAQEQAGALLLCTLVLLVVLVVVVGSCSSRSALISGLKVEQVQHSRSVKSIALPCTLFLLKVERSVQLSRMLEILRWTAARVHPLSSIIIIIIIGPGRPSAGWA